MTLGKIGAFNEAFKTSMVYYNPKDNHLYPKVYAKTHTDGMVLYLHNNHYCLIDKDNKAAGIREVEANFKKGYATCNNTNVAQVKEYAMHTKVVSEDDTFAWDLEASPDPTNHNYFRPWASGVIRVRELESILAKRRDDKGTIIESYLDSDDPIPDTKLEFLTSKAHTFSGVGSSIRQLFKHLGRIKELERPTVIAHNGSRFDNYLAITEENEVGTVIQRLQMEGFIPYQILKTPQGIVEMKVTNRYTSVENQELFKQKFLAKNKGIQHPLGGQFYQRITFRCSLQHLKASLKNLCESYKLARNLRKTEVDHDTITLENYAAKRDEWEPYLKYDVISLGCVILKYSKTMIDLVGQNMSSCISSPSLTLKGWYKRHIDDGNKVHTHADKYIRWFIRQTVYGGRVFATRKQFVSQLWTNILELLKQSYTPHKGHTEEGIPAMMKWYRTELVGPAKENLRDKIKALA